MLFQLNPVPLCHLSIAVPQVLISLIPSTQAWHQANKVQLGKPLSLFWAPMLLWWTWIHWCLSHHSLLLHWIHSWHQVCFCTFLHFTILAFPSYRKTLYNSLLFDLTSAGLGSFFLITSANRSWLRAGGWGIMVSRYTAGPWKRRVSTLASAADLLAELCSSSFSSTFPLALSKWSVLEEGFGLLKMVELKLIDCQNR